MHVGEGQAVGGAARGVTVGGGVGAPAAMAAAAAVVVFCYTVQRSHQCGE